MKIRDVAGLSRALDLAENGLWTTTPNPRVGCVIYRDGKIIGEGWHQRAGLPHAEILAMRQCEITNADVYVSMEPCAHAGRTAACAPMLAEARPARVIIAMPDPNPQVAGRGIKILRQAGIDVVVAAANSDIFRRAVDLNIGFISRMIRHRPWLRLKIAATMDGKTALSSGLSQWISDDVSRQDAHRLRARSCAIMTGIGTLLQDNPRLTARHVKTNRQPLRILIDRDLQAATDMNIFADNNVLVATVADANSDLLSYATVLSLPGTDGKVDLAVLLKHLGTSGINEVTVEAGRRLCGALMRAELVDEIVLYQAPIIFGGGLSMFDMATPTSPRLAPAFKMKSCQSLGKDIKIIYESPNSRDELLDATAQTII